MSRFLMIDIGAGTMDIMCYNTQNGEHFKAVAPSPVRSIAAQIEQTQGPLIVTGVEMGGGPVTDVLRRRANTADVVMSSSAAATLHHDLERVSDWGITIADDQTCQAKADDPDYTPVELGDIQPQRIKRLLEGLGLPMDFQAVALCAQDHGTAPKGTSHLDFRHNLFQDYLNQSPLPHNLLFGGDEVPEAFSRLASMARSARQLKAREIYVMDSGMAAMVGASQDLLAKDKSPVLILDIATSHTVAAVMEGQQLAGGLEYHTSDITAERLDSLLVDLADGRINHDQILAEGGHGAYLNHAVGFDNIQVIIATGPKRRLVAGSRLPISWGAPWGDNMMTGTVGLLESLRLKKGLDPILYI